MTNKALVLAAAGAFGLLGTMAATPEEEDAHPISENIRGHENTEWSTSYAWHLTDEKKTLPRVLLIGDSICQDYSSRVVTALEGKMTVTYWASCFGFAAPCYMQFLSIYLDEAEYAVIHFNNGCHSIGMSPEEWGECLRAVFDLIRQKQPKARIVWTTTTPNVNSAITDKIAELNAAAAKVVAEMKTVATDDLFALMDPLDRSTYWRDNFHFTADAITLQADQVVDKCLKALDDAGTAPVLMVR